jgi:hypothetical protein
MRSANVRKNEGIFRVGFGVTSIEVARTRHCQARHVADLDRRIPAQLEQQRGRSTGLIHDDRGLVRTCPKHQ